MGQVQCIWSIKSYLVLALYIIEHVYFSWAMGVENIHQTLKSPAIWDEYPFINNRNAFYVYDVDLIIGLQI